MRAPCPLLCSLLKIEVSIADLCCKLLFIEHHHKEKKFVRWFFKTFYFERTLVTENLYNSYSEFLCTQILQLLTFTTLYYSLTL